MSAIGVTETDVFAKPEDSPEKLGEACHKYLRLDPTREHCVPRAGG